MRTSMTSSIRLPMLLIAAVIASSFTSVTWASINWDGKGNNSWWFDPVNWNTNSIGEAPPHFIPPSSNGVDVTDTNINMGWNLEGEGVVYDPLNDPFYEAAAGPDFDYPTEQDPRFDRDTIWRFYITTGNATADNKVTIKSGTLEVISVPGGSSGYVLLGRGGSVEGLKGTIVQTGGKFDIQDDNLDIGSFNGSAGNGVYEYYGGTLEAGLVIGPTGSNRGIRLAAGGSAGSARSGYFGVHNGGEAGHIRVWDFTVGAHIDSTFGTTNSVSTVEFFANQDGTRPIQVMRNLSINHQDDSLGAGGKRSAVLKLSLDAAPALVDGVPIDMGLFDVQGAITGQSGIFYSDSIDNGGLAYNEGDLISATIGSSTYNWTISYTGNIDWSDFDNSVVSSISGPGTGIDVVLIGHSADVVGTPGDFNSDGTVDGRDFLAWQRGASPAPLSSADLAEWQTHYGDGSLSAVSAIPEPGTALLGAAGLVSLLLARRRSEVA